MRKKEKTEEEISKQETDWIGEEEEEEYWEEEEEAEACVENEEDREYFLSLFHLVPCIILLNMPNTLRECLKLDVQSICPHASRFQGSNFQIFR